MHLRLTCVNVHCLVVALGLLLTYFLFLSFPFHWPTLVLFAGLAAVIGFLSFTSWPLVAGGSTLVASAVTLFYGWTYAPIYEEYGLLICSALFVIAFVVLRCILRHAAASTPEAQNWRTVAKELLRSSITLIAMSVAVLLIVSVVSLGFWIVNAVALGFWSPNAVAYREYWLLACGVLFVVALAMLFLIARRRAASMPKMRLGTRAARAVLAFFMILSIVGTAIPLSMPSNPKVYLATALAWTQGTGYYSDRINWSSVNRHALEMIRGARTSQDTYRAIAYILSQLPDQHNFFWSPQEASALYEGKGSGPGLLVHRESNKKLVVELVYPGSAADKAGIKSGDSVTLVSEQYPTMTVKWEPQQPGAQEQLVKLNENIPYNTELGSNGRRLSGNIGYVNMYGTLDVNTAVYASKLHQIIRQIDTRPTCGWVVDLRRNTGGFRESMIPGVGPILGEGNNLLTYVDAQGNIMEGFGYKHGTVLDKNGAAIEGITPVANPYQLKKPNPPVAILTGPNTASAAEGTIMAFKGRANVRIFGENTYGVPTGPNRLPMIDGAELHVTSEIGSDRTGKTYQQAIVPDEPVHIDWKQYGTDQDPVLQHAQHWLASQSACKA
ncbi:MAG: hypothetical protein J2P37_17740 [Ktedonobacteraceae bacterium]|nr:hypothetical protein [Ktedonobacteraceae bacterium]